MGSVPWIVHNVDGVTSLQMYSTNTTSLLAFLSLKQTNKRVQRKMTGVKCDGIKDGTEDIEFNER